jgi:hypothetical protein
MTPFRPRLPSALLAILLLTAGAAPAVEIRGTGSAALVGGDLTDPENDGDENSGAGFNATFNASFKADFGFEAAFDVFDNRVGSGDDKWCCASPSAASPHWVSASFASPVRLMAFTIASGNDGAHRDPDVWQIQGSNDGVNFADIYAYDANGVNPFSARNQVLLYRAGEDFPPPPKYRHLRFRVSSAVGEAEFQLNELEFFDVVPGAATIAAGVGCSLSDAIRAANTAAAVGGCATGTSHTDVIELGADIDASALVAEGGTRFGAPALFADIDSGVILRAGGGSHIHRDAHACSSVDAAGEGRHFNVIGNGFLLLDGIELRGGCADHGGAIVVNGNGRLILDGAWLTANTARSASTANGGAVYAEHFDVADRPAVIVEDAVLADNAAYGGDSAVSEGGVGSGGAVHIGTSATLLTVSGARFERNLAVGGQGMGTSGGDGFGGAISAESVPHLVGSRFIDNLARGGNGVHGGLAFGGAIITDGIAFADTTLLRGNAAVGGNGNAGNGGRSMGGAILGGIGQVQQLWFDANRAEGGDGTLAGGDAFGGALRSEAGVDAIVDASFSANEALGGDGGSGDGGQVEGGALSTRGNVPLAANLTIAGNRALAGRNGTGVAAIAEGGGWAASNGNVRATHLTVVDNIAGHLAATRAVRGVEATQGAGLLNNARMTLDNSVLERNRLRLGSSWVDQDCARTNTLNSLGHNRVAAPGNCDFVAVQDIVGASAGLLALADNGCTSALPGGQCLPTVAMQRVSSVLDAGSCAISGENVDAIGTARPQDIVGIANAAGGCDIGALEGRDGDNDGAVNYDDNCPATANANQADADADGSGDACDACFHRYAPQSAQTRALHLVAGAAIGSVAVDVDAENGAAPDAGMSYALAAGPSSTMFAIAAGSGVVTLAAPTGAAGSIHPLDVVVTDCEGSTTLAFVVTVVGDAVFANSFE